MEKKEIQRSINLKCYLTQNRIKVEKLQEITKWSRSTAFRKLKGTSGIDDEEIGIISTAFNVPENFFDCEEVEFKKNIIKNDKVSIFLKNVNLYIEEKKLKKDLIAKRMGVHSTTFDKYLKSEYYVGQDIMANMAAALKKTVDYFLEDNLESRMYEKPEQLAFFSGIPSGKQLETTNDLIDFINYHDALLSMTQLINM
ncbi:MAG: hypothetical protein ACI4FZ_08040 [Lachnospiraceae bacterium]